VGLFPVQRESRSGGARNSKAGDGSRIDTPELVPARGAAVPTGRSWSFSGCAVVSEDKNAVLAGLGGLNEFCIKEEKI
jgi:hypothetical protein